MKRKCDKRPLATIVGTAIVSSLSATATVQANENPFAMKDLSGGYMQLSEEGQTKPAPKEGVCAPGACGANMQEKMKSGQMNCGAGMQRTAKPEDTKKKMEGKCAGMTDKDKEGSTGSGQPPGASDGDQKPK
jgi:uncharacterized low-complexity protein